MLRCEGDRIVPNVDPVTVPLIPDTATVAQAARVVAKHMTALAEEMEQLTSAASQAAESTAAVADEFHAEPGKPFQPTSLVTRHQQP
jgi:hypothetical protein